MDIKAGEALSFEIIGKPEEVKTALFILTRDLEENPICKKTLNRGIDYAGREDDSFFYEITLTKEDIAIPGRYFYELKLFTDSVSAYKGMLVVK